jgi:hypothetical protein
MPAVLARADLCIASDLVRLAVGAAARAPDSEVMNPGAFVVSCPGTAVLPPR